MEERKDFGRCLSAIWVQTSAEYQLPGNIPPADFGRPLIAIWQNDLVKDRLAFEAGPLSKIFGRGDGGQTLDAANEY
jgi:hypothetical protein